MYLLQFALGHCSRVVPALPLPMLIVPCAPPLFPFLFFSPYLCFFFSPLASASVTMQRASFGRASVSIATVQAPTPQSGSRLHFGATLLVPCPLCIPAKPYLPVSHSGRGINCSSCRAKSCFANAKYCSNCGAQYPSNEPTNWNKTIGFKDFKKRKETERSTRFQPKKKLKAVGTKLKAKETKVSINIDFLRVEASGNLKRCRGKTLPVKVRPTANAQCILEKGVMKHINHDKKVHEGLEYVLLYPDHSEVVNLPGTTNAFILVECVNSVSVLACTGTWIVNNCSLVFTCFCIQK